MKVKINEDKNTMTDNEDSDKTPEITIVNDKAVFSDKSLTINSADMVND